MSEILIYENINTKYIEKLLNKKKFKSPDKKKFK